MPPRFSYVDQDTLDRSQDLAWKSQLDDGIAEVKWQSLMDQSILGVRQAAYGSEDATSWTPTPVAAPEPLSILTSERPDAMAMQAAQQEQAPEPTQQPIPGRAADDPGGAVQAAQDSQSYPAMQTGGGDGDEQTIGQAGTRASRYAALVAKIAREEGVPADALAAIMDTEDSDERSESVSGARGLMQVVPGQGFDLPGEDAFDPATSIRQGARALREKHRMTGDWDEAGAAYFGYGTDPNGVTTSAYRDRYVANRARYRGAQGQQSRPQAPAGQPAPMPQASTAPGGVERPTQFAEGLSYDEAIAACGLAGVAWFMARAGRPPKTVAEVRDAAVAGKRWSAQTGMYGAEETANLLRDQGVAVRVEDGVNWENVRRDVLSGNPVLFDTNAGSAGHYYTVQGARQRADGQWEYDLGTSATDLTASKGRRWFTADEVEGLGFGRPFKAIYSDNPETPAPSPTAGRTSNAAPASPSGAAAPSPEPAPSQAGSGTPALASIGVPEQPQQQAQMAMPVGPVVPEQEYDPRDADSGPRETGYVVPPVQPVPTPTVADPTTVDPEYTRPHNDRATRVYTGGLTLPPEEYDPRAADEGPREAAPGSVGAQPLPRPLPRPQDDPGGARQAAEDSQSTPPIADDRWRDEGPRELPRQPREPSIIPEAPGRETITRGIDAAIDTAGQLGRAMPGTTIGSALTGIPTVRDFGSALREAPAQRRERMWQIQEQAARDQGIDTRSDYTAGPRAVGNPDWRARNPLLAQEYDALQTEEGLDVVGQAGDAARLGRGGRALQQAAGRAPGPNDAQTIPREVIDESRRMSGLPPLERAPDPTARVAEPVEDGSGRVMIRSANPASPNDADPYLRIVTPKPIPDGPSWLVSDPESGLVLHHAASPEDAAAWAARNFPNAEIVPINRRASVNAPEPEPAWLREGRKPTLREAHEQNLTTDLPRPGQDGVQMLGSGFSPFTPNATDARQALRSPVRPDAGDIEARAVEHFGATESPRETGYILRDGSGLDFSGKKYGGPGYSREMDHREIGAITGRGGTDGMIEFMGDTGAVRFSNHGNDLVVDIPGGLSAAQKRRLAEEGRYSDFVALDITNPKTGETVASHQFDMPRDRGKFNKLIQSLPDHVVDEPTAAQAEQIAKSESAATIRGRIHFAEDVLNGKHGTVDGQARAYYTQSLLKDRAALQELESGPGSRGSGVIASAARGIRPTAHNAAQGGVLGAVSEDLEAAAEGREADPNERMRRFFGGATLAATGGRLARGRGQMVGSGVVPNGPLAAAQRRIQQTAAAMNDAAMQLREAHGGGLPAEVRQWQRVWERARAAYDEAVAGLHRLSGETPREPSSPEAQQWMGADYGKPYPDIRGRIGGVEEQALGKPSAELLQDSRYPRDAVHPDLRAEGIGPKITPAINLAGRQNAAVPFDPASAALGGSAGAMSPDEEGEGGDPWKTGGGMLAAGILGKRFPGAARAMQASQQRAANMAAKGLKTPSVWEWIKQAGYSGIYGPATAASSVIGGAQELVLGQPKEAIRALVSGNPRSYGAQVRAQVKAVPEALTGLVRVLGGGDSATAARASGGSQGTANLSERVVNPTGHTVARALERPGELLTEAPDAVFRPLFQAQGREREAHRIATAEGLRGQARQLRVAQLMQQVEQHLAGTGTFSQDVDDIIAAGDTLADRLGYKGPPGGFTQWLAKQAGRDDAVGVAASFLAPFPSMAGRVATAAARSTPGLGLLPAVRRGQPKFDVVYDQVFGTAAAAGMAYWAFNGGITGSGPSDPEKRKEMMDLGWQPNSTLVGGYYIPNRLFQRFGPMLDTAGEIHDALAYGKKDQKPGQLIADFIKRTTNIASDQVGLSGLSDLHTMLTQGFESQFPGFAARSIVRYLPYGGVSRAVAASGDTVQRKADRWAEDEVFPTTAIGQNLQAVIPGLRQNVPRAQGVLGQDVPNPQQGFGAIIPRITTARDNPVVKAFLDAGVDIGKPPADLEGVKLTPEQQKAWNTARGDALTARQAAIEAAMRLPSDRREERMRYHLGYAADRAAVATRRLITPEQRAAAKKKAS